MNTQKLRIAIAQINAKVGDICANTAKIKEFVKQAEKQGSDMVCFPELAICGYPPEDLLLKNKFIKANISALKSIAKSSGDIVAIVGFVDKKGSNLYNAAALIHNKKIKAVYHKAFLPNYGVFDEKRYFSAGKESLVFKIANVNFGVNICEDIWRKDGPLSFQAKAGAGLIININASPYYMAKGKVRENLLKKQAKLNKVFIVYNNLVGGQDELVFDGQSIIIDNKGKVMLRAQSFVEELRLMDLDVPYAKNKKQHLVIKKNITNSKPDLKNPEKKILNSTEEVYQALTLGLRDYVKKNNFKKVIVGLSGGIDSSLAAALAVDALGADNVRGVFMPSKYSSKLSRDDAYKLAKNLNIYIETIPINDIFDVYLSELKKSFKKRAADITEENLQARIRGNILMSLSNKFGYLVLTTGNKSEVSCGYCTLYGDMAGGFSIIKDVPKILVYKLARFRNKISKAVVIPESVINKEPTAELKPNQKDSDSLPRYELLDAILKKYVEEDKSLSEITSLGFNARVVSRVISLVDKSEYKRRQSAPGIKITPRAFGRDRRMPITNGFKG
ncbi:MAG TPA: NAD+ synthase [Candidatus Omnitrophica bacterium]|nr:NAD+ synthase [Candidatus Omnitrophota bacterium]